MGQRLLRGLFVLVLALSLNALLATGSRADTVAKFNCGVVNTCSGGPVVGGPPFSATGANAIGNLLSNVPGASAAFTFSFDTSSDVATLTDATDTLTGTISGPISQTPPLFGLTQISFGVLWDLSGAPNVSSFLGPDFGGGMSNVQFETSGGVVDTASITVSASPVPEPSSLALLGVGFICAAFFLRRK